MATTTEHTPIISSTDIIRQVYMAYGSHTGNGESMIKSFANELTDDFGLHVKHSPLNDLKDIDLKHKALCVIIVCSVCGTGDCPENADNWWRWIKARSQPKDMFHNVPFAVLGLGDVKYKKLHSFCIMGVKIDKRLEELGGRRFAELCCADESTDFEETVEMWKEEIKDKVIAMCKE